MKNGTMQKEIVETYRNRFAQDKPRFCSSTILSTSPCAQNGADAKSSASISFLVQKGRGYPAFLCSYCKMRDKGLGAVSHRESECIVFCKRVTPNVFDIKDGFAVVTGVEDCFNDGVCMIASMPSRR